MGKVFAQQLKDFSLAESYYQKALKADHNYAETHINYLNLLLEWGSFELLENQLELSKNVQGVNLCELYLVKAKFLERTHQFELALETINSALSISYCTEVDKELEEFKARLHRKIFIQNNSSNTSRIAKYPWLATYSY